MIVGPKIVVVEVVRERLEEEVGEDGDAGGCLGSQEGMKQYPEGISKRGPSDILVEVPSPILVYGLMMVRYVN